MPRTKSTPRRLDKVARRKALKLAEIYRAKRAVVKELDYIFKTVRRLGGVL